MRIFCLCNNWLGWQTLKWLRQQEDEIVGLAIHPAGRSKFENEIRQEVADMNCVVVDGSQLKDSAILEQIRGLRADIAVSVLFSYVLKTDFIEIFPRGCINLHPALLPHNRGCFPNVWSIVSKTPAGVTLHYIDEGIDTGDIIAQKEVAVEMTDTGATLYHKLEAEGLELFQANWAAIRNGTCSRCPQQSGSGSFHRCRDVENIDAIDLGASYRAGDLIDVIRARTFAPYAGAYFVHEGKKIFLRLELKAQGQEDESND